MAVVPVPEGYHTVNPYLLVEGVGKLISFLIEAFEAQENHRSVTPEGRIAHADLTVGDTHVMLGEAQGPWTPMPGSLYMYVPDVDAVYARALAAGGVSIMEPQDQFYGDRMCGVRDPSGNCWWIATHIEEVEPEELARRQKAAYGQNQDR